VDLDESEKEELIMAKVNSPELDQYSDELIDILRLRLSGEIESANEMLEDMECSLIIYIKENIDHDFVSISRHVQISEQNLRERISENKYEEQRELSLVERIEDLRGPIDEFIKNQENDNAES